MIKVQTIVDLIDAEVYGADLPNNEANELYVLLLQVIDVYVRECYRSNNKCLEH